MATSDQVGSFLTEWLGHSAQRLEDAQADAMGVAALLDFVYEEGFAWRDVARMTSISVARMRSWRVSKSKEETFTDSELEALARLVGWCDALLSHDIGELIPAAWFEVPFNRADCPLTPMDVFKAGRFDLLAKYALDCDGDAALDAFDPQWRERYATCWEVFEAEDGWPSIRMKS